MSDRCDSFRRPAADGSVWLAARLRQIGTVGPTSEDSNSKIIFSGKEGIALAGKSTRWRLVEWEMWASVSRSEIRPGNQKITRSRK